MSYCDHCGLSQGCAGNLELYYCIINDSFVDFNAPACSKFIHWDEFLLIGEEDYDNFTV